MEMLVLLVLPFFSIFAEIRNFRSPWKSQHVLLTSGKKSASNFFFVKIFFRGKKTAMCDDFLQTKWRLNSPMQEEQKNCRRKWRTNSAQGEQEEKKKDNGV